MGLFAILGKWVFQPFIGYFHLILHSFTFPELKIPYFDTSQGHCDPFSVHMPLFVISYLRSVLCSHGCLTCYMLLSVLTAVLAGLISCNLQAVHTHNPAAPTAIFLVCLFVIPSVLAIANFSLLSGVLTVSVFSWHFHASIFAISLLMLSRLFYCCFLNFFSYKNRRSEFGIRLTKTRTTVIGRNSPNVMT